MKTKALDIWISLLFCLSLGGGLLLLLLLPKQDFSQNEKRFLAAAPELSWRSVSTGRFGEAAESYLADHLPGREFLVGLQAHAELLSGRQAAREIYRFRGGALCEAPVTPDAAAAARSMGAVNDFAARLGREVDVMLVPSAGWLRRADAPPLTDPYRDDEILAELNACTGDGVNTVDLLPVFEQAGGGLFYRTDHHWTSRGAYLACAAYLREKGREALPESAYTVTAVPGFLGTTYARAALWETPAEELELWDSGGDFLVENGDGGEAHEGLFYAEHLAESDKYPVFLDGNHSLVRITNRSAAAQGRLLVIRDSFANCLGCFLADAYREVVLVDLRYYRGDAAELAAKEDFDEILFVYAAGNFLRDGNLGRLT